MSNDPNADDGLGDYIEGRMLAMIARAEAGERVSEAEHVLECEPESDDEWDCDGDRCAYWWCGLMTRTDIALAGAAIITAGGLLAAAANRSAEAYSMSLQASCAATITAAAVIELSGADCRPEGGYPPAIVDLCRITHGRTARQVAGLPQCRESAP